MCSIKNCKNKAKHKTKVTAVVDGKQVMVDLDLCNKHWSMLNDGCNNTSMGCKLK